MNITKTHNIVTLSNKKEIQSVLLQGQKVYTKFGLIFLYKKDDNKLTKIGILIKKKSGNAVKRNYIKRIIKQFIRNEYKIICTYNKIVFLYNYKDKVSYNDLHVSYINALNQYEKTTSVNN